MDATKYPPMRFVVLERSPDGREARVELLDEDGVLMAVSNIPEGPPRMFAGVPIWVSVVFLYKLQTFHQHNFAELSLADYIAEQKGRG